MTILEESNIYTRAAEAGEFVTIDALFQASKKECG
ncbi:transposase [Streptococcus pneumoniae]|nr:transposase [Streptococcus pneumoniae]